MIKYWIGGEFDGVLLMPAWKLWVLEKLNLPEYAHESIRSGPIYEQQLLITQRIMKATCETVKAYEQERIIKLLEDEAFTKAFGRSRDFNARKANLIALIKGEGESK